MVKIVLTLSQTWSTRKRPVAYDEGRRRQRPGPSLTTLHGVPTRVAKTGTRVLECFRLLLRLTVVFMVYFS